MRIPRKQVRGELCPLGLGKLEGEAFDFGERDHAPDRTPAFRMFKSTHFQLAPVTILSQTPRHAEAHEP
jgi:hypothetical protein